jgi:hypothetical protein
VIGAIAVFFVTGELPLSMEEIRARLEGVFPFGFALFLFALVVFARFLGSGVVR